MLGQLVGRVARAQDGRGRDRQPRAADSRLVAHLLLDLLAQDVDADAAGDRGAGVPVRGGDADQLELGAERAGEATAESSAAFASSEPS